MALENQGGTPNPGGQSGAGDGQPAAAANSGTGPSSGAATTGGQPGGQQPPKKFEYTEDRTDWIPRHRLGEESGKRTAAEKKAQELETALELERNRVRALTGVNPQDPKTVEQQEVKQVLQGILQEMYPGIDILKNLNQDQLNKVLHAAEVAMSTSENQMNAHTADMYSSVETATARELGVEKLSAKQVGQIRRAYIAEAEACMAAREDAAQTGRPYDATNDFMARHLRKDPSLVKEFVKEFLGEWYTPAKRTVTAQQVRQGRRAVPGGGRSADLTISNQPVGNLDNKDDFKKALLAARNAGG